MGEDADGAGERVRPPRRAPLSWDSHALNPENKKWRHARARATTQSTPQLTFPSFVSRAD